MKPVICFGEALIDFLNTGKTADGQLSLNDYRQFPGGAPANAAVAVAKLGGKALFAGQVGADGFGDFLKNALQTYAVDTRFLLQHPTAKTALAFVTLDNTGDRSFSFYREYSADVLFQPSQIEPEWFADQPLFHFCSNTLTTADIASTTLAAVKQAKQHHCWVSFDVNLRHNLWAQGQADAALVNQLVVLSDMIKFSKEELEFLSGDDDKAYIQECLSAGVSLIVITDGANPIQCFTKDAEFTLTVPKVSVVDTTAGGDSFSGSLLYALSTVSHPEVICSSPDKLKHTIEFASNCGALTVNRAGAFPALPSFDEVAGFWPQDVNQ